jgi:hypothetical protein
MLRTDVELQTVRTKVIASQIDMLGEHIQNSKHLTITSSKLKIGASIQVHLKKTGKSKSKEQQKKKKEWDGVSRFTVAEISMESVISSVLTQVGTQTNILLQHSVHWASMIALDPLRSVNMFTQIFIKTHTGDLETDGQSQAHGKREPTNTSLKM